MVTITLHAEKEENNENFTGNQENKPLLNSNIYKYIRQKSNVKYRWTL